MGGFAYIDTSFPRVPGDSARLMTEEFQATGKILTNYQVLLLWYSN